MINDFHFGQKPGMRGICSLFLLTAFLAGCVEPIVMDPEESEMPVVVNCALKFSDYDEPVIQKLTLQYAKGKSQKEYLPVGEDATVYMDEMYYSKKERTIQFFHKHDCVWETEESMFKLYRKYVLHIEIPGREPITAETISPPVIDIEVHSEDYEFADAFSVEVRPEQKEWFQNLGLWVTAHEFSGPDNAITDLDYLTTDHPGADGLTLSGKKFSDLSFEGPVEGFYGDFYRDDFQRAQGHIGDYPLYEKFIRIGKPDYEKTFFVYPGPLFSPYFDPHSWINNPAGYAFLHFYILNEDLDKYVRSAIVHLKSVETDLNAIYSIFDDIHSNVNGAYGIFGSYMMKRRYFMKYDYNLE